MKKLFLLLMACCLSLAMSAKVAYLIPVAQRVDMDCQECDLPYEACDNGEQSPERRAFKWFRDEYTGEKTILYLNDLANIPADVNAIWIHVDRVGFNTAAFDAVFTSEVKENLKAFVNRGGNVFLAKQATRLEYDLVNAKHFSDDNRAELDYSDGGYIGAQTWGASIQFYATNNDDDNNNNRVWGSYANHAMFKNAPHRSDSYLEYVWSDSKQITDHNSGFPIGQMNMNGTDWRLELWGFQQKNNCRVIGGWANGDGCHYGGIVEFYPTASRKGTVVMLGLAAYQWINNNAGNGFANVKKSTEDLLKYLDNKAVKGRNLDKLMTGIFDEEWCYPASLETENHEFRIVHPNIDGWTMSSWIPEDQRSIANIRYIDRGEEDRHDRIEFYQEGTVDLHVKLTEDREFQAWPKGDYEFVRKVKFTYASSAQAVADADLSSNGLDGSTGKFMVLHKNMRGLDSLAYTISFDGIEEANRAEVRKVQDGEYTRLVFDKAGTVKLNIRLNEPNYREDWAKGEHPATKTITFDQPAFTWTHKPDIAALNEDKPAVVVTCDNVPGATVKYESSDPTIASVNETTGKISYIKEGTCQINAFIEINGVKFESDKKDVTVNGLNITWSTAPAETAKVGEEMTIAAAPQYGSAEILFERSNCTYADGKLSFTHAGTATVRPYAEVNGTTYYGVSKTIEVSPDLKWTTAPQSAFVGEQGKLAQATTNEGTIVYSSSAPEKVSVDESGNLTFLGYNEAGKVTITATVTIDGKDYSISGEIDANLPNVMWITEPSDNAYVGQTLDIAAQLEFWEKHAVGFETVNCTYADGRLTIGEGETATVRPYVELTTANKKYYGVEKMITITTPAVTWTHEPDEAAVMEDDKPAAQAKCNIDELTVYYRSLNTDVATIDAETGKISYLKPSGIEGSDPYGTVTIEAYVTIGATEYKATKAIKIFGPKADWVTRPATTATVGDVVEIAGHVRFGAAALGFDYADEYIEYTAATETESAKITFLKAGTTTIRPYAEAYGAKYYNNETATADKMGEEITITVAPDLKWTTAPQSGCIGETGKVAVASTSDGTIAYSSSDAAKVSVDEAGNLTFHATYETPTTVKIYAKVTINGTTYSIEGDVNAGVPYVYWADGKKPTTTYRKDETPIAQATYNYGNLTVQYETTNCTWADNKLTFAAEGEATIQPYVEYESQKYYGEKVTITVTPAADIYTRNVTPGRYGTICLERTSTKLEGGSFWQPEKLIKNASGDTIGVQLVEVEQLVAGYGYFFLAEGQQIKVTMSLAEKALTDPVVHDKEQSIFTHGMHGTFAGRLYLEIVSHNECILSNNELRYGSGNYVEDHRAYIKLSEVEEGGATSAPGRRRVTMGVNQPNVTTGVELIPMDGERATKVMLDGQIYILRAGRIYTVEGQLVK